MCLVDDEELTSLGVIHLGDRVVLRSMCKNFKRKFILDKQCHSNLKVTKEWKMEWVVYSQACVVSWWFSAICSIKPSSVQPSRVQPSQVCVVFSKKIMRGCVYAPMLQASCTL